MFKMNFKSFIFVFLVYFTFCGFCLGADDNKGNDQNEKDCAMATEICGLTKEEEQKLKDNAKRKFCFEINFFIFWQSPFKHSSESLKISLGNSCLNISDTNTGERRKQINTLLFYLKEQYKLKSPKPLLDSLRNKDQIGYVQKLVEVEYTVQQEFSSYF